MRHFDLFWWAVSLANFSWNKECENNGFSIFDGKYMLLKNYVLLLPFVIRLWLFDLCAILLQNISSIFSQISIKKKTECKCLLQRWMNNLLYSYLLLDGLICALSNTNIYICFENATYRQVLCVPIGTNNNSLMADLILQV